ncbi:MAG: DUF1573 domain-containing protein [Nanoarchaeota archaeon]|nr:DUF1573 domain-containing protein [Nanoarchaeota archaeon]
MRGVLLAVFLASILTMAGSAAAQTPQLTFIPQQFSANASFLVYATTSVQEPARLTYSVAGSYGGGAAAATGSIPFDGDRFFCYFSHTDADATCGPSPFTIITTEFGPDTFFDMITLFQTTDDPGTETAFQVATGSIRIVPTISISDNGTVSVLASTLTIIGNAGALVNGMTIEIYHENLTLVKVIAPTFNQITGFWATNFQLKPGKYYLSFFAPSQADPDDFGGEVFPITVPGTEGTTCTSTAAVEGNLPLVVEPAVFDAVISANTPFTKKGFKITNLGGSTLPNISVTIPSAFASYLSISLGNSTTLAPNASMLYSVTILSLQDAVSINAFINLTSNGTLVGQIPVTIGTILLDSDTASCPGVAGEFTVTPSTWFAQGVVGETLTKEFTIKNNADKAMEVKVTTSTSLTDATYEPLTVQAGKTDTLTVTLEPDTAKTYQGTLSIGDVAGVMGTQSIGVSLQVFDDVSSQLDGLQEDLDYFELSLSSTTANQLASVISDIQDLIDDAQNNIAIKQYGVAAETYSIAQEKFNSLDAVSPYLGTVTPINGDTGEGLDLFTFVIPAVVVLVVLAVLMIFLKKRKSKVSKEESILEDEFQEEPQEESKDDFEEEF